MESLENVETRQIVGMIGAVVLFLGVFAPVERVGELGGISFVGVWVLPGTLVLLLAAATLGLALWGKMRWLWLTGGLCALMLPATYFLRRAEIVKLGATMPLEWGWIVMGAGVLVILVAAGLHEWEERS
ncbi:MAG: hypothetical protein GXY15_13735 [Candidatus Hydrogenedentes bacterium]|nr:hypothetical protein [Candidatus Hydrogenedentota bacterium]